jgi:hypothetical protein
LDIDRGVVERDALDWNPQRSRCRRKPRRTWKRTTEKEALKEEKV